MEFIETAKNTLSSKKTIPILVILILLGVVLMVSTKVTVKENSSKVNNTSNVDNETELSETNAASLEKKLENILSQINGVGEVEVLIVFESSNEEVVLKDTEKDGAEKTVFQTESSISKPYVTKTLYSGIQGIIIAAQGAGRAEVKAALSDTVAAVFDIPIHKVKILEKN